MLLGKPVSMTTIFCRISTLLFVMSCTPSHKPFEFDKLHNDRLNVKIESSSQSLRTFEFSKGLLTVVKKNKDFAAFNQWIGDELGIFLDQFKTYTAPYPGFISQKIICQKSYLKKIDLNKNYTTLTGYIYFSNSRLVATPCLESTPTYRSMLLYVLCNNNSYKIIYHHQSPVEESELLTVAKSFHCK